MPDWLPEPAFAEIDALPKMNEIVGAWSRGLDADPRFQKIGRDYLPAPPQILHPEYLIGEIVSFISTSPNRRRVFFVIGRVERFVEVKMGTHGIAEGAAILRPKEGHPTVAVPASFFKLLDLRVLRHERSRISPLAFSPRLDSLYLANTQPDFSNQLGPCTVAIAQPQEHFLGVFTLRFERFEAAPEGLVLVGEETSGRELRLPVREDDFWLSVRQP